jgi:ribulose kinase
MTIKRSLENISKDFGYWKEVRDYLVNQPYGEMNRRALEAVIEKMHELEKEARADKYFDLFGGFNWASQN